MHAMNSGVRPPSHHTLHTPPLAGAGTGCCTRSSPIMRRRCAALALTMVIPFRVDRLDQGPGISTGRRTLDAPPVRFECGYLVCHKSGGNFYPPKFPAAPNKSITRVTYGVCHFAYTKLRYHSPQAAAKLSVRCSSGTPPIIHTAFCSPEDSAMKLSPPSTTST